MFFGVSFGEPASISGGMGAVGSGGANSGTTIGGSEIAVATISSALLAQQLPPLPKELDLVEMEKRYVSR